MPIETPSKASVASPDSLVDRSLDRSLDRTLDRALDRVLDRALAARARRPVAMGAALIDALSQYDPSGAQPSTLKRILGTVLTAAVLVIGSFLLLHRGEPWSPALSLQTLALASLAALGVCVVFVRGPYGLGLSPRLQWGYVLSSLLVFSAVALTSEAPPTDVRGAHEQPAVISHAVEGTAADAVHHGSENPRGPLGPLGGPGQCASYETIIAALVGAMLLRGARRTSPVSPESVGAAAGVCAGMVGALALHTHAPTDSLHVALAHGAPLVAGLVVGALVGRKTLAP